MVILSEFLKVEEWVSERRIPLYLWTYHLALASKISLQLLDFGHLVALGIFSEMGTLNILKVTSNGREQSCCIHFISLIYRLFILDSDKKSDMNSSTADELGYSVYYDEMAKFLSQKNLPSSELEIIIQNMWNSIDQLQKKIYHDKAKKGKNPKLHHALKTRGPWYGNGPC